MLNRISKSLEQGTLDYIWLARSTDFSTETETDGKKKEFLRSIGNASFIYYDKYIVNIQNDPSLNAITSICNMDKLSCDVTLEDKQVSFYSHLFNNIINSDRKLHKCYDCGTNGRAIFLKLIALYRGKLYLTPREQVSMENYSPVGMPKGLENMKACARQLTITPSDSVYICSLGIQGFGHVWIFEKVTLPVSGKQVIRHYQSALKSHLTLDFIADMNYGEFPDRTINIVDFFTKLERILSFNDKWNDAIYSDFHNLFAFTPVSVVDKPTPTFCWTYITY
jgi:hypothetical protein